LFEIERVQDRNAITIVKNGPGYRFEIEKVSSILLKEKKISYNINIYNMYRVVHRNYY